MPLPHLAPVLSTRRSIVARVPNTGRALRWRAPSRAGNKNSDHYSGDLGAALGSERGASPLPKFQRPQQVDRSLLDALQPSQRLGGINHTIPILDEGSLVQRDPVGHHALIRCG
jgi:hypothetical protein